MEGQEIRLNGGGTLTLQQEGAWVRIQAQRKDDGRGLYKVWVHGRSGQMLLGTLAPEGGQLCLRRRLSCSELERCGCWPVTGGRSVLAFSFRRDAGTREDHPEQLVQDAVLRQALRGKSVLLRRTEGGFQLLLPFEVGQPFPLVPLFCLSKLQTVEGQRYAVFFFDREGKPMQPCGD